MSARKLSAAALAVVAALGFAAASHADDGYAPRVLSDSPYIVPSSPYRLGFDGVFVGSGMRVQKVHWGSIAHQIGLERGDVIEIVNGQQVFGYQHYLNLLASSNGSVTLGVRDINSGRIVYLNVNFGGTVPAVGGSIASVDG